MSKRLELSNIPYLVNRANSNLPEPQQTAYDNAIEAIEKLGLELFEYAPFEYVKFEYEPSDK